MLRYVKDQGSEPSSFWTDSIESIWNEIDWTDKNLVEVWSLKKLFGKFLPLKISWKLLKIIKNRLNFCLVSNGLTSFTQALPSLVDATQWLGILKLCFSLALTSPQAHLSDVIYHVSRTFSVWYCSFVWHGSLELLAPFAVSPSFWRVVVWWVFISQKRLTW